MADYQKMNGPRNWICFDGIDQNYELWEEKFKGHLMSLKLHKVLGAESETGAQDVNKKAEVYGQLVQYLDDESIKLI